MPNSPQTEKILVNKHVFEEKEENPEDLDTKKGEYKEEIELG